MTVHAQASDSSTVTDLFNLLNGAVQSSTLGQPNGPAQLDAGGRMSANSTLATATATATPRTLGDRAADRINPRDYGAIGDGASHTAGSTLGISTLAGLVGYAAPNGTHPYAWASAYPNGTLFNLDVEQAVTSGSTSLLFNTTATIGLTVSLVVQANSGATQIIVGDLAVTSDQTPIAVGSTITGPAGLLPNTTVTAISGFNGNRILTLSAAITQQINSGVYVTATVTPASGVYSPPILWASGIARGDLVTGSCIAAGTQVAIASPARMEVVLDHPTTCALSSAATLTFIPSWLSHVVNGMQVQGPTGAIASGTTVTGVNTTAGTVTISAPTTAGLTAQQPFPNVTTPTSGSPITFYAPWTDAQAAALQMDFLGIQAAINANVINGGSIELSSGAYQLNASIMLPIAVWHQPADNCTWRHFARLERGKAARDRRSWARMLSCVEN